MADLGNLFFSLGLDTKSIDTAWAAALKKYGQKAQIDLKLNVGDMTKLEAANNKTLEAANKRALIESKIGEQVTKEIIAEQNLQTAIINTAAADSKKLGIENKILLTKEQINTQEARTAQVKSTTNNQDRLALLNGQKILTQEQQTLLAAQKIVTEKGKEAAQTERLRMASERHRASIENANTSLKSQNRLMQNLHTMAASYISIFAAGRLLGNLVQISGEFETQKVSLQAILRDLDGANAIFDQIKKLAVKSPFQFKDLISYTKQLSAFSIPMNELFDTTKMLADVSAGLGVGMDRLVLAYGQIRAASVLRGQEVRQLTEAGIPVIEALRKKFEELGETGITAADVFDKISARLVPFSMIKDMFTEMTSAGGMFFNMQEIKAETLQGKVSNLVDAYQIMFAEIGEKGDKVLKGAVDTTRYLISNYEKVGKVLLELVATYGVYKASMMSINALTLLQTKYGLYDIATKQLQIGATLRAVAAQGTLNAVMAINPYVAVAAGVALLSLGIYKLVTYTTDYEKSLKKLNDVKEESIASSIKEEYELSKLYDKLKTATKGTKEYEDARNTIQKKYGDYLTNLRDEKGNVVELADAYQYLADKIKESALQRGLQAFMEEASTDYSKIIAEQLTAVDNAIQKAIKNKTFTMQEGALLSGELTSVISGKKKLEELSQSAKALYVELTRVSNGAIQYAVGQAAVAGTNIQNLGEQAKRLLGGSITSVNGGEAPPKPAWMNMPDWAKSVREYVNGLKQINEGTKISLQLMGDEGYYTYIERLRDEYSLLGKQIKDAGKNIDTADMKAKLSALKGVFNVLGIPAIEKESTKPQTAQQKLEEQRAAFRTQLEIDTQNKLLAIETEGNQAKAIAVEKVYKNALNAAEKFKQDRLQLLNEAKGAKKGDKGYISVLTGEDLDQYNYKVAKATEEKNSKIIKIESDSASEIVKIWKEATELTLSEYDREKAAINEKYRLLIERATEAAAKEEFILKLKEKQNNALIGLDVNYAMDLVKLDQETKNKLAETSKNFFDEQNGIKRRQLQIDIDAAKERVALLQAEEITTGKDNSDEIKRWIEFMALASKQQRDIKDNYFVVGELLGDILAKSSDEFVQKVGSIISSVSTSLGSFQKAYSKDGTGLDKATSIVGLIMSANQMLQQARDESSNKELNKQKLANTNLSNRVAFEQEINNILEERVNLGKYDIFNIENNTQVVEDSIKTMLYQSEIINKTMRELASSTIFSAEGTGKRRLGGSKTGTYEFTLADILQGLAPVGGDQSSIGGAGVPEIINAFKGQGGILDIIAGAIIDPADLLQGRYADKNARKDAFLNLQQTVKDALTSMGKSVSDFTTMSADDLLSFFTLMESAGTITDEGTKRLLATAKEQIELAKKAFDDMKKAFSDIVGDLGSSLSDSLVNAFANGNLYSAIDAFHTKVGDVIADLVAQMVFAATMKPFFDNATEAFMASYGYDKEGKRLTSGDKRIDFNITDDLTDLFNNVEKGMSGYEQAIKAAQDMLVKMGFAGFTTSGTGTTSNLGNSIQSMQMTENTANLVGSYVNAIRADGASRTATLNKMLPVMVNINDAMGNGLAHLAMISSNTMRSANNSDVIVEKLNALTLSGGNTKLNVAIKV